MNSFIEAIDSIAFLEYIEKLYITYKYRHLTTNMLNRKLKTLREYQKERYNRLYEDPELSKILLKKDKKRQRRTKYNSKYYKENKEARKKYITEYNKEYYQQHKKK